MCSASGAQMQRNWATTLTDYAKPDCASNSETGRRMEAERIINEAKYNLLSSRSPTMAVEFFFYHQSFRPSKCATCFVFTIFLPPRLLCPSKPKLLLFFASLFGQFSCIDAKAFVRAARDSTSLSRQNGVEISERILKCRVRLPFAENYKSPQIFLWPRGEAQMCCYESNLSWQFVKSCSLASDGPK